ncbi:MAG: GntR family transcriptional regulator [Chloroflexi bacterium]|nr:GntR family transcriptional regulator [Chloroflexota bacterium]OJW04136.1 MAG: hypothetical protein BGO39_06525 [Chloroflexi bacterium 54-19]
MPTNEARVNAQINSNKLISYFREVILDGVFIEGSKLPGEQELAEQYNISRGTVRQALDVLAAEGLIERTRGKGTFVRPLSLGIRRENKNAKKRIGLVFSSSPDEQFTNNILKGVEQATRARGYQFKITYCDESQEQQARDIASFVNDNVAGIISIPVSGVTFDPSIAKLKQDGVPVVLVDRYLSDLNLDHVVSDNFTGSYRITEHLILQGYERIGFVHAINCWLLTTSTRDRWRGYCAAMEDYGLPVDDSLSLHTGTPNKWRVLPDKPNAYDEYILRPNRPEAVVTCNDYLALSLLQAANRSNIKVPEELALVGFDDLPFAAHLNCPLTTVAQPMVEMGIRAANLIINRIEGDNGPTQHIELLTSVIVRESCSARMRLNRLRETRQTAYTNH